MKTEIFLSIESNSNIFNNFYFFADPHKYQEREWGKTSISIALELALDAVLSVVEE